MDTRNKITEGLVIGEMNYGDSSKIVNIYTRDFGKIKVLAKGALNPKSGLLATTQSFSICEYMLSKGMNFYYIKNSKLIHSNFNLRKNYDNLIYASFLLELIEKSTIEEHPNERCYELMKKSIILLTKHRNPQDIVIAALIKYLSFIGYRPKLDINEDNYFSIKEGSIDYSNEHSLKINKADLKYLNEVLYSTLEEDVKYDDSRKKLLLTLLINYTKYNLDIKNFNTIKLIK